MKSKKLKFNDGWSFAKVNGRLAEIHFDKKYGVYAHAYVKRSEYKTKREQKMIDVDIKKCQFIYRKGYYIDKLRGIKTRAPKFEEVFPEIKRKNISGPFHSSESLKKELNLWEDASNTDLLHFEKGL